MRAEYIEEAIAQLSNKFQKEFYKNVYPKIDTKSLEVLRIFCLTIIFVVTVIYIYFVIINIHSELFYFILFFSLFILGFFKFLSSFYKRKVKKIYYDQIVKVTGLKWFQGEKRSLDAYAPQINKSKLFMHSSHIIEDDVICGSYMDVPIKISDACIMDEGYSTKNSREKHSPTRMFKGILVYFNSNKKISSTTLIKPKVDLSFLNKLWMYLLMLFWAFFGGVVFFMGIFAAFVSGTFDLVSIIFGLVFFLGFGYWFVESAVLRELRHNKNLEKINLEDTDFSKKYQAYSYEQVEGRYLLTAAFIDRFLCVGKAFKNNSMRCAFVEDKIILAIPTFGDSFEISSLFISLKNPKFVKSFFDQIASILVLVEYFKLDENTNL